MWVFRREFIMKNIDYIRAIREVASEHGIVIKVVGTNVISVRRHNELLTEIFRGIRSIRFLVMLLPDIRQVRHFTRLENGDIRFII